MSRNVKIGAVAGVLAVSLVTLGATLGWAQLASLLGPEKETLVYDGDAKVDSGGLKIRSWGSGKAEPVSDGAHYYVGPEVLKVASHGPYQGIVLQLGRPADLSPYLSSKNGFIELRVMPAQLKRVREQTSGRTRGQTRGGGGRAGATAGGGGRGAGGGGGGRGGGGGGRGGGRGRGAVQPDTMLADSGSSFAVELTQMGGGGGRGGGGGGGRGGGGGGGARGGATGGGGRTGQRATQPGATGAAAVPRETGFSARNLRLVLFTDKGQMIANEVPVEQTLKDERGWYRVAYPLARFAGEAEASRLEAVGIFTDEQEEFYLGQVRLVIDRTAVKSTIQAEPAITHTGKVIEFSVGLAGGNIDPEVAWDFDESDGVKRQAVGPKVKCVYKQPGDYIVTAVVEDRSGVQDPIRKKIGVRVEQATAVEKTKETTTGGLAESTLGSSTKKQPAIEVK